MTVNFSLRTKGILAILILTGHLALIAVFLAKERDGLLSLARRIEANQASAGMLEPVVDTLA